MRSPLGSISATLALLLAAVVPLAAQHQHTPALANEKLGHVNFPTTCSAKVQVPFERGVALLHSFGYDLARTQFQQIQSEDPHCALAYWGDAMTLYHQLWQRPSKEDLKQGHALIQKAQSIGTKSNRERDYIAAAAAFYVDDDNATYEARNAAYSQSLNKLREQYPDDHEAAIFYALSLIASPDADQNDFAYRKQAVAILNGLLENEPDHPGIAHYLIHACDNPQMAPLGLAAARRYAEIAPASPHALHMPSHIFTRLGMWPEDIQSNLLSKAAAEKQHDQPDRLHAMDFLQYAYLQLGETARAKDIETEALQAQQSDFSKSMKDYFFYVQVHFPASYTLETHGWQAALQQSPPPNAAPDFVAVIDWAKAIAAGHLNDAQTAAKAVADYDAALQAVKKSSYAYVADQMITSRDEAHAWLDYAQGKSSEAIQLLTTVAARQDKTGKGEVELPAREMLADMLLLLNRPEESLREYQTSLDVDPNRFGSLYGAGQAAEKCDQQDQARKYYELLLTGRDQSHTPELEHARAYLSGSPL